MWKELIKRYIFLSENKNKEAINKMQIQEWEN